MFEIFLIEGQDYGGFPRVEFLLFRPGCQSKEGMLQNIWNAGLLTGGLSMQREPMSTSLHPTPDALRPAARHQRRFTEHIVFPSKLLRVRAAAGEEISKKRAQSSHSLSLVTRLRVHVCICLTCKQQAEGLKITSSGMHHQAAEQSPAPLCVRRGCESMRDF